MQGNIENALQLVAVGNACLAGRDVTGFWPDAPTFKFTKYCEFRTPPTDGAPSRDSDFPVLAPDPLAWFALLKPWCKGLRLHHVPSAPRPEQSLPGTSDRMMVGFVGGGPRWLIEAEGPKTSQIWEGFQRLLDKNDPTRRIWGTTHILQREIDPAGEDAVSLPTAAADLRAVLPEIEAYARENDRDNFAECFARARAALDGPEPAIDPASPLVRYAGMTPPHLRVLDAIMHAWVFGGMGSWNDWGGDARYDDLSDRLFRAVNDGVCGVANATFRS